MLVYKINAAEVDFENALELVTLHLDKGVEHIHAGKVNDCKELVGRLLYCGEGGLDTLLARYVCLDGQYIILGRANGSVKSKNAEALVAKGLGSCPAHSAVRAGYKN